MPFLPSFVSLPESDADPFTGVVRDGSLVRSDPGAEWPDRCVVCNAPAGGNRRKLAPTWYPQEIYLLLVALPLFFVAAFLLRQTAAVDAVEVVVVTRAEARTIQG